jgi:hypothetical protein
LQSRKRKVGGLRGLGKPTKIEVPRYNRKIAIAGIQKGQLGLIFLFLFSITSCSHFSKNESKSLGVLQNGLRGLCFQGEGKGRIQLFKNKHLFRFESIDEVYSETWKMGVNIPGRGEEILELNYKGALKDGVKVKGKFISLLKKDIRSRRRGLYYGETLNKFISRLGMILKLKILAENKTLGEHLKCKKKNCFFKESKTSLSFQTTTQKFILTLPVDDEREFQLEGFNPSNQKYQRLRGQIISKNGKIKESNGIGINLFFDSCLAQ